MAAPSTLYLAQSGEGLNAALAYVPGEVHLVLRGPVAFLLGHPLGLACLAGGLLFGFTGLWWIEAIAAAADADS